MSIINSKSLRPRELRFKSEKLQIDYITLNISMKGEIVPEKIGRYLLVYGFNSTIQESEKDKARNFLSIEKNKHWVALVKSKYNPKEGIFWNGIAARFSGRNGRFFYDLIKQNKIKFERFPEQSLRLGRFDLNYSYDFDASDFSRRSNIENFFKNCRTKYLRLFPSHLVKISNTKKGLILRANDREGSSKFFRIYEKFKSLRFELEMKRKLIEPYQNSFFSYSFEEFEDELVNVFCNEFSNLCSFDSNYDSNYSSWLLKGLRKKLSIKKLENLNLCTSKAIVSPYNIELTEDRETSFNCLQLLSFIQRGDVGKDLSYIESLNIVIVKFALVDFLKFLGKNDKSTYQREKVGKFLNNLLDLRPLRIKVSDIKFQNFHFCSFVGLEKVKNRWLVELRVAANALSYIYPYTLPEILLIYNKKSELTIKAQFIESFNTENYLKEFEVEKPYKNISLSYDEIKNRKKMIVKIFKDLKTEKIIDNRITIHFKDMSKDKVVIEVKELTHNLLGKLSKISFKERWSL